MEQRLASRALQQETVWHCLTKHNTQQVTTNVSDKDLMLHLFHKRGVEEPKDLEIRLFKREREIQTLSLCEMSQRNELMRTT